MKTTRVIQSISAALAVTQATAEAGLSFGERTPTDVSDAVPNVSAEWDAANTTKAITALLPIHLSNRRGTFSVRFPANERWTEEADARYRALVVREATGQLTTAESTELDGLQGLKRRHFNPPTGAEIIFMYRRQKLDDGMIELLQRYVGLGSQAKDHPEG